MSRKVFPERRKRDSSWHTLYGQQKTDPGGLSSTTKVARR